MKRLALFKWPALLLVFGIILAVVSFGVIAWMVGPTANPALSVGETPLQFRKPGHYTVWLETKASSGDVDLTERTESSCEITGPSGTVSPIETTSIYGFSIAHYQLEEIQQVYIDAPGNYMLKAAGWPEGSRLHLKPTRPRWYVEVAAGASMLALALIGISLVLSVIVFLRMVIHRP
ncbi:MAG: hypothetical protein ACK4UN_13990 [Limisphaerales bacterium]